MKEVPLHILPILIAAIVRFGIGAFWFSPAGFIKTWQKITGRTDKQMKQAMPKAVAADFVGNLIVAFVLVHILAYAGATTFAEGACVGFMCWLGFIAIPSLAMVTWERRPLKFYGIIVGCQLVSLLVLGGGLAVWY